MPKTAWTAALTTKSTSAKTALEERWLPLNYAINKYKNNNNNNKNNNNKNNNNNIT